MKGVMRMFLGLALATVAPLTVAAQQSPWGSKVEEKAQARAKAQANAAKTQPTVNHPDWRAIHHDHDRDADGRPPGWDHGRKVGWRGGDLPPGQAKKINEHPYYHHRRHHHRRYWDREHHRWVDRDHDRH